MTDHTHAVCIVLQQTHGPKSLKLSKQVWSRRRVFLLTSDMTLRLLNWLLLSGAVASGIVGMREALRSGPGVVASCGEGRRRREEERRRRALADTGARVDEWRRDSCMAERVAWTQRETHSRPIIQTHQIFSSIGSRRRISEKNEYNL